MPNSETLLAYARIFEMPRRDPISGKLNPPSEIELAAAHALRLQAHRVRRDEELVRLFDEADAHA